MVAGSAHVNAGLNRSELTTVGLLNIVQGLPSYFFTIALPSLLREAGASLNIVALTYIVWLPWALKWLWAPIFDRRPALRIATLRVAPLGIAIAFAALSLFSPQSADAGLFAIAVLIATLAATLQIVLAGEIIRRCDEQNRALANAIQVGCVTLGGILGGFLLLSFGESIGWRGSILATAALILVLGASAFLISPDRSPVAEVTPLRGAIRYNSAFALLLCSGLATTADGFLGSWLIDRGFSAVDVGWFLGLFALTAMLPLVGVAGALLRWFGQRATLASLFLLKALMLACLLMANLPNWLAVALAIANFSLNAAIMTVMSQFYMSAVRPDRANTGFAFLTSAEALVLMVGGLGVGQLAVQFDYAAPFGIAFSATIAGCVLALALARPKAGAKTTD
ncbi:MAG: MFS transporter [Paracoccaceae bacterium]